MSTKAVRKTNTDATEDNTPKVPTKPKIATKTAAPKTEPKTAPKTGGKKPADPETAAATAAKREAEKVRYAQAQRLVAERGLVTIFEELTPASVQDKWANVINLHALETINYIKQQEVRKESDYNPYPSSKFLLFEDKVSANSHKKVQVKVGTTEAKKMPSRNRAPLKRGAKPTVEEPKEDATHVEHNDTVEHDDTVEAQAASSSEKPAESKKANVATFTKDAKFYLGFLVMRFVDDYFSSEGGKHIKSREEFTTYTYANVTKDITSHVSRAVVTTVNRMHPLISNLQDRSVPDDLSKLVGAHFADRGSLIKYMGDYLSDYFKLIGVGLANQLWVTRKIVNHPVVYSVIRSINLGNNEDLVDAKVVKESEPDYGLSCGYFQDALTYISLIVPKAPKKPKDPNAPKKEVKAKPGAKTGAKTKQPAEPAEPAEPEEPEEPEPEEPEEELEEDPEEEAEEEVVDVDVEEEEEEEVAPKKSLKKLR